jgi:hypothetical protein
MKRQSLSCISLLFCLIAYAQNKTYYISFSGNDRNDGLTIANAWQTLVPINNLDLEPGDQILFEGGETFTGTLQLDANDVGTPANPIKMSSYGNNKATIYAAGTTGIYAFNTGGIHISDLILKGDGSDHDGIDFLINQTTTDIDYIFIDSVEVFNFGGRGLLIGAFDTDKGFNHVKVKHSSFHDNNIAGLETFGAWALFSNTDFTIAYCKFYNNTGKATSTAITGNGVVLSGIDGGVIEYCEAYNNGASNRSSGGGPVGIWVYDTKNIIIQYCESHHNKAGLLKDGGGFDIDGGSQNCIIQYCYSHDNEGAGFALVEYGSTNEFAGNIIRYNVSQNDGRKNSFGAIVLFAADAQHPVKNSEVYNNTVFVNALNLTNGRPSAISILSQNFSGVSVRNNIFYVAEDVDLLYSSVSLSTSEIYLQNNNYFSSDGVYNFWWNGNHYSSFNNWKAAASGHETEGIILNPLLENAGTGGTVQPADGGSFNSLFGYTLNSFSPLVDKALKSGDMGAHDFFGNALPLTSDYDIGAAEAMAVSILPLNIIYFTAEANNTEVLLRWKVTNEEFLQKYEIERSENGSSFKTIGSVTAIGATDYSFIDKNFEGADVYYRLRYIYPNGKTGVSNSIKVFKSNLKGVQSFYREGKGAELRIYSDKVQLVTILSYSETGALMYCSSQSLQAGYNSIIIKDSVRWPRGVYFIQIPSNKLLSILIK